MTGRAIAGGALTEAARAVLGRVLLEPQRLSRREGGAE
jgi:hypothetical protein